MTEQEKQEIKLQTCSDCGFGFDSVHENDDGSGYSCPVCEVSQLEKKLDERDREVEQLKKRIAIIIKVESKLHKSELENQHLRKDIEGVMEMIQQGYLLDELYRALLKALEGEDNE